MIMLSACLLGVNCCYNGRNNTCPQLLPYLPQGKLLPICPEQLGGLPTPRIPAEIFGGTATDLFTALEQQNSTFDFRDFQEVDLEQVAQSPVKIINQAGRNVTQAYLRGAFETLNLARAAHVQVALLKARSPSCGCGQIYDGSFKKVLVAGDGITAALLKKFGIKVISDEEVTEDLLKEKHGFI